MPNVIVKIGETKQHTYFQEDARDFITATFSKLIFFNPKYKKDPNFTEDGKKIYYNKYIYKKIDEVNKTWVISPIPGIEINDTNLNQYIIKFLNEKLNTESKIIYTNKGVYKNSNCRGQKLDSFKVVKNQIEYEEDFYIFEKNGTNYNVSLFKRSIPNESNNETHDNNYNLNVYINELAIVDNSKNGEFTLDKIDEETWNVYEKRIFYKNVDGEINLFIYSGYFPPFNIADDFWKGNEIVQPNPQPSVPKVYEGQIEYKFQGEPSSDNTIKYFEKNITYPELDLHVYKQAPPIILLNLNRTVWDNHESIKDKTKIMLKEEYTMNINNESYTYKIKGINFHKGKTPKSGHYVAFVKKYTHDPQTNIPPSQSFTWYLIDDLEDISVIPQTYNKLEDLSYNNENVLNNWTVALYERKDLIESSKNSVVVEQAINTEIEKLVDFNNT